MSLDMYVYKKKKDCKDKYFNDEAIEICHWEGRNYFILKYFAYNIDENIENTGNYEIDFNILVDLLNICKNFIKHKIPNKEIEDTVEMLKDIKDESNEYNYYFHYWY